MSEKLHLIWVGYFQSSVVCIHIINELINDLIEIFVHFRFKDSLTSTNPLIDGHDYTFLDGRPTPLNNKKRLRMKEQLAICVSISILTVKYYIIF